MKTCNQVARMYAQTMIYCVLIWMSINAFNLQKYFITNTENMLQIRWHTMYKAVQNKNVLCKLLISVTCSSPIVVKNEHFQACDIIITGNLITERDNLLHPSSSDSSGQSASPSQWYETGTHWWPDAHWYSLAAHGDPGAAVAINHNVQEMVINSLIIYNSHIYSACDYYYYNQSHQEPDTKVSRPI